jgi:lactate permease
MPWQQLYDPFHAQWLSTIVAALPVVTLFFVLVALRQRVWVAALAGAGVAIVVAIAVFGMPVRLAGYAALHGVVFGFLRIAWVIVASIFLYEIAVEAGQFDRMKRSIAHLSNDRRIQAVLIAFCFGAFLEGLGGGGAPVAIAGAFLIGLGFPPFQAAVLCLLANTAPVAWGGVGNPIRTLAGVTGLSEPVLSAMAGRILPPFSLILPIWLVRTMTTTRGTFEVLPALLVSGGTFALIQFVWSNYIEIGLVDVVASIGSLLVSVAFLRHWRPKHPDCLVSTERASAESAPPLSTRDVIVAWSPFILTSVFILICGLPVSARWLRSSSLAFPLAALHNQVLRMPPLAPGPTPESAVMDLNVIPLPGTAVFAGALISAWLLGVPFGRVAALMVSTWRRMIPSLVAISAMVALAFITRYAGMDSVLGLSLTGTGWMYPLFGTLLGWLGVALTGTDAGSNALFGNLQQVTAKQLGLSPVLMAAANSTGGVMGKMIDAQSIVVASVATGQHGEEAAIFKAVIWHSITLATLVGVVVMLYAYVLTALIPH